MVRPSGEELRIALVDGERIAELRQRVATALGALPTQIRLLSDAIRTRGGTDVGLSTCGSKQFFCVFFL